MFAGSQKTQIWVFLVKSLWQHYPQYLNTALRFYSLWPWVPVPIRLESAPLFLPGWVWGQSLRRVYKGEIEVFSSVWDGEISHRNVIKTSTQEQVWIWTESFIHLFTGQCELTGNGENGHNRKWRYLVRSEVVWQCEWAKWTECNTCPEILLDIDMLYDTVIVNFEKMCSFMAS